MGGLARTRSPQNADASSFQIEASPVHGIDRVIVLQDIPRQGEGQGLDPAVIVHVEDKAAPGEGIVIYPVLLDGFIL